MLDSKEINYMKLILQDEEIKGKELLEEFIKKNEVDVDQNIERSGF